MRDGRVLEGSSSNLFAVIDGCLCTPPTGPQILTGITRDLVLELARDNDIECGECDISVDRLRAAEEIWITSSTREIVPVTRLDDAPVGDGRPGPLWRRLDGLYQAFKAAQRDAPA